MKRTFTFLTTMGIALLFVLPLSAQKKQVSYYTEHFRDGKFVPYDTGIYTYDNNGRLATETNQYYDESKAAWVNFFKAEFSYNSNGDRDYYDWKLHDGTQWAPLYRYSYLYNPDKKLNAIYELRYSNGNWRNYSKEEYVYTTDGKQDTVSKYYLDTLGNATPSYRSYNSYNAKGKVNTTIYELWDETSLSWVLFQRFTYQYDSLDRERLLEVDMYLNPKWVRSYNYTYTYGNDGLFRKWERLDYDPNRITQIGHIIYEFDGPLSAKVIGQTPVNVFPNPATSDVTFTWESAGNNTIEIFDITGKPVWVGNNIEGNSVTLNTTELTNGIYVYTLRNIANGTRSTGRLVINK
ncbi:T9SS type A sorting domain-containing protein [Oscillatoria amoena NRMC-F 0135]|nr:T9SS type A sorting domain-containing protein [Oscillatoria amoena NRMC-F 0135]